MKRHAALGERPVLTELTSATPTHLWERLRLVRSLHLVARSANSMGWNGHGSGVVAVVEPDGENLEFHESGTFEPDDGGRIAFRNVFHWRQTGPKTIRLQHLRHGPTDPVALIDLVAEGTGTWSTVRSHHCRDDDYRARLYSQGPDIVLHWSVTGPRKQATIEYRYLP